MSPCVACVWTVNSIAVQEVTIHPPVINCHNISTPLHPAASLVRSQPVLSFPSCLLWVLSSPQLHASLYSSIIITFSSLLQSWQPFWGLLSLKLQLWVFLPLFLSSYLCKIAHHVFNNSEKEKKNFFYCSDKSIAWSFAVYSKNGNKLVQWADLYSNHSWEKHMATMRCSEG